MGLGLLGEFQGVESIRDLDAKSVRGFSAVRVWWRLSRCLRRRICSSAYRILRMLAAEGALGLKGVAPGTPSVQGLGFRAEGFGHVLLTG